MDKTLLESLWATFRQYRKRYAKAFFMVLISNCLLILNPLIFRRAILALEGTTRIQGQLSLWVLLLLTVSLVSAYFKYKMRIEFIRVSRDVESKVRHELFAKVQAQSQSFYDRHSIGELLSRLTNDISAYRDVLGPGIMYPLFFLTLVIPGFIALFSISSQLATISLLPLFVIPLLNYSVRGKIYSLSGRVQESLAQLSSLVQEHYSGIRILKCYGIHEGLLAHFKRLNEQLRGLNQKLLFRMGIIFPFFTLLTRLVTVFLLLWMGFITWRGWALLSPADFVSFMWIQTYIFFPILMLAWVLPVYQRGRAAYDRLVQIYEEPIEVQNTAKEAISIPPRPDIHIKNLSFTYPNSDREALSAIHLFIPGGSFIGITGPVGAGKSTLFRLLSREYEIPGEKIFFANRDIHEYPLDSFRRSIVTVEQTPFLFSKTIAENLSFGKREATGEELESVAEFSDLKETLLSFPEGYETIVGERGITLSGGQRQRIAMARAFLLDRSIFLLDDIFSAVDFGTEKRIFSAMQKNLSGKTVLLITHRVSILQKMDHLIYMAQGRILEEGTAAELVALNGYYAALVALQEGPHG